MNSQVPYADLWALLRKLGYDCDQLINEGKHRVCEHPAGSLLTLADYPPEQPVHPQTLYGVRLELDNFGLMSREEFDRWVDRRSRANAAKKNDSNGTTVSKMPQNIVPGKLP